MKSILKTTGILFSIILLGFLILTSFNNPVEYIIGNWILESDNNNKWVFTNNNCYWYYDNNLQETFTYTIQDLSDVSNTSISTTFFCNYNVRGGNKDDYYLKLIDQDNKEYCYEILNIDNQTLSINYLGQAKIKVFNRQ